MIAAFQSHLRIYHSKCGTSGVPRAWGEPNFIYLFCLFFFFGGGEALLNRWFKQHDRWQHTPPLNLTALIKLTVAIKHIPRKYVSNDTWSPAGHLRSKLYSKILLKPTSAGEGAQFGTQGWDLHLCRLFLHGSKSRRLRKQIKSHHDERHVVAKMCLLTLKLSLTRGCRFFFFLSQPSL